MCVFMLAVSKVTKSFRTRTLILIIVTTEPKTASSSYQLHPDFAVEKNRVGRN